MRDWNIIVIEKEVSELSVGVSVKDADRSIVFPWLINLFGIILRYVTILSDLKCMNFSVTQFNPLLNVRRSIKYNLYEFKRAQFA